MIRKHVVTQIYGGNDVVQKLNPPHMVIVTFKTGSEIANV